MKNRIHKHPRQLCQNSWLKSEFLNIKYANATYYVATGHHNLYYLKIGLQKEFRGTLLRRCLDVTL